jgi:aldose 1-epimerase
MAYSIEETNIDNIKAIQLKNGDTVVMEVLPDHGAMLNKLLFQTGDGWLEAIDGYESAGQIAEEAYYKSAVLFPFPNRLENGTYRYEGREYSFPTEEKFHGNAIHGFVWKEQFKVLEMSADDTGGMARVAYYNSGERNYFPFAFGLVIVFTYSADRLDVKFDIENRGNGHMPIGFGWHPYLTINKRPLSSLKMKLPFVSKVELNDENLPTGNVGDFMDYEEPNDIADAEFDDCFKLIMQDNSIIYSPEDEVGLAMEASKECLFLQVFTPPDRTSIAIEPMNCNINAFNNQEGLMDLERGSFYHINCAIRLVDQEEFEELTEE